MRHTPAYAQKAEDVNFKAASKLALMKSNQKPHDGLVEVWRFPRIRSIILGVPMIRIILY